MRKVQEYELKGGQRKKDYIVVTVSMQSFPFDTSC